MRMLCAQARRGPAGMVRALKDGQDWDKCATTNVVLYLEI